MARLHDGVIFDMDGTLIVSNIDFAGIRRTLGIPVGTGILEGIEQMDPDRRRESHSYLLQQELGAVSNAALRSGAGRIISAIRQAGMKLALLTRNAAEAVELVLRRFEELQFDLTLSREQGPIKPEPDGILRACREMGISPRRTVCVGDFEYDIVAANAAGAVSVLLCPDGVPAYGDQADHTIGRLSQLGGILGL